MGFFIRKTKTSYRILQQVWTPERKETVVPREAYSALGFHPNMTVDEAKARAKQINKQNQIESRQIANAAKRVTDQEQINNAYLPESLVSSFSDSLSEEYTDNPTRLTNLLKQWNTVQKIISHLALDPVHFFDERNKFFNYFRQKHWAPDYIKKLTRMINLWGQHYARKTNSFFRPLPRMSSTQINKLIEVREDVDGIKRASDPLTWDNLLSKKSSFENNNLTQHWNWMFIGLWFGLRPKEIDGLKNKKNWRVEVDFQNKINVLSVYQSKLMSITKDKRWKIIPIYFDEQKEALKIIESGEFKRPLNKTLRRFFEGNIETYSPRKGFTDLMLQKGFGLEDISTFLGHCNINTTWRHYKNKMTFKLPS